MWTGSAGESGRWSAKLLKLVGSREWCAWERTHRVLLSEHEHDHEHEHEHKHEHEHVGADGWDERREMLLSSPRRITQICRERWRGSGLSRS